jgi:hypothetical protein
MVMIDGMPSSGGSIRQMAHAHVDVHVPGLSARAVIKMHFPAPADTNRVEWAEIAYEKASMMLDPA